MVSSTKAEKSNLESVKAKLDDTFKVTSLLINEDPKENGWKNYVDEPNLKAYTRSDKATSLNIIKTMGILNASPRDAVDLLVFDIQGLMYILSNVDKCQTYDIIKEGEKEYVFRYILSKKPNLLVSRRDFVLASTYKKNEDESYTVVFASIDDPKIKGDAVRAETVFYGAKLSPTDKPDQCKISSVELNDLKGSLPKFIVKSSQKDAGYGPKSYNEYFTKHKIQKSEVKALY